MTKNRDKIYSRFQTITILIAKRTRLSRQNVFCRSQEKILVFRTGCDVKFSGRIGKKKWSQALGSLGPPLVQSNLGFTGNALGWFTSYLANRFQHVVIDNVCSSKFDLKFGVHQGSCLGPLLLKIYTSRLFELVTSKHLPQARCYAEDTQLYLAFKSGNDASQLSAITAMETCIDDLRRWMVRG